MDAWRSESAGLLDVLPAADGMARPLLPRPSRAGVGLQLRREARARRDRDQRDARELRPRPRPPVPPDLREVVLVRRAHHPHLPRGRPSGRGGHHLRTRPLEAPSCCCSPSSRSGPTSSSGPTPSSRCLRTRGYVNFTAEWGWEKANAALAWIGLGDLHLLGERFEPLRDALQQHRGRLRARLRAPPLHGAPPLRSPRPARSLLPRGEPRPRGEPAPHVRLRRRSARAPRHHLRASSSPSSPPSARSSPRTSSAARTAR